MGCPALIQTSSLPTPPYRPWVWGKGAQTLPCKGPLGAPHASYNAIPYSGGHIPPLSPSLDGAFQPPVRPNMNYNLFGAGSLGPSLTPCQWDPCHSLCSTRLVIMLFHQLSSRPGETLVLDKRILCRVLFLHRGEVHKFSPHKYFGILGRD
jgi:hypothetical protein